MSFHQNISFSGCNPFMGGCFNPRLNFFLGMAGAFAGIPMPVYRPIMPMCGCSVFNPYMSMGYVNPYAMGGFGGYYQTPQIFSYAPQASLGSTSTNPFATTETKSDKKTSTKQGSITPPLKPSDDKPDTYVYENVGNYTPTSFGVKSKVFLDRVKEIARRLNCNYKDLLGVMQSESSLNPQAVNKSTGATGLIQFMPSTARSLGTTTSAIRNMSAVKQLDYVEKYLEQMKRQAGFGQMEPLSGGQLYALIFLPGRAHREVLTQAGEKYYSWKDKNGKVHGNQGLDANNDGKITKSELDAKIKSFYVNESCFVA